MSETGNRMCVFLPCSRDIRWAVPQNSLGEIVTVPACGGGAPAEIEWRGQNVPVMDFAAAEAQPWCTDGSETGHVAVFLALAGEDSGYWGVALRGEGLGVWRLEDEECREVTEVASEYSLAAFEHAGRVYQVPDLPALQRLAHGVEAAASVPA